MYVCIRVRTYTLIEIYIIKQVKSIYLYQYAQLLGLFGDYLYANRIIYMQIL